MIALFDGSHAVDDGLSAEVGYYAATHGRIAGIRSGFRLAENRSAPINPAVEYFIDQLFDGPEAYDSALKTIKKWADEIRRE